jgi:hypothetical protein
MLRLRLRSLFRHARADAELDAELRFHREELVQENLRAGMTLQEARRAASRAFGGGSQLREECRDMRQISVVESVAQDLRHAVLGLAKSPAFTTVVVLTLALGIGGATAVFSVFQGVLLAPLPYEKPEQLVRFYQEELLIASSRTRVTAPHFKEIRDRATSFQDVAAFQETDGRDLPADGRVQRLRVLRVTPATFVPSARACCAAGDLSGSTRLARGSSF